MHEAGLHTAKDPEHLKTLPDYDILKGVDRHYDGGLAGFLQDHIPYQPDEPNFPVDSLV